MIHGWLEKPSYILLAGMVKQKRAFAYHLMHVKGISFKPEFFIYTATNDVEGVRAKGFAAGACRLHANSTAIALW